MAARDLYPARSPMDWSDHTWALTNGGTEDAPDPVAGDTVIVAHADNDVTMDVDSEVLAAFTLAAGAIDSDGNTLKVGGPLTYTGGTPTALKVLHSGASALKGFPSTDPIADYTIGAGATITCDGPTNWVSKLTMEAGSTLTDDRGDDDPHFNILAEANDFCDCGAATVETEVVIYIPLGTAALSNSGTLKSTAAPSQSIAPTSANGLIRILGQVVGGAKLTQSGVVTTGNLNVYPFGTDVEFELTAASTIGYISFGHADQGGAGTFTLGAGLGLILTLTGTHVIDTTTHAMSIGDWTVLCSDGVDNDDLTITGTGDWTLTGEGNLKLTAATVPLIIDATGEEVTATGPVSVKTLTLTDGTLTLGAQPVTVAGTVAQAGGAVTSTGLWTMSATGTVTITDAMVGAYFNITAGTTTLGGNLSIAGLQIQSGAVFDADSNSLALAVGRITGYGTLANLTPATVVHVAPGVIDGGGNGAYVIFDTVGLPLVI